MPILTVNNIEPVGFGTDSCTNDAYYCPHQTMVARFYPTTRSIRR